MRAFERFRTGSHLGGAWMAVGLALVVSTPARSSLAGPGPEDSPPPSRLSRADQEAFLLEGEVVHDRAAEGGITLPRRVTLRRGDREHDALVQSYDEYRAQKRLGDVVEIDFRDSWRHNVAAYRLDKLLGLGFVPVTVAREYQRQPAGWTWWVDDVLLSERQRFEQKLSPPSPLSWVCQMHVVRIFDQLIYNFDRSLENLLIDTDWQLWMIDHTRAFKVFGELRREENLPSRCEKGFLAGLRRLDKPLLEETMDGLLDDRQIDGLLARRDVIVRFYDDAVAERGAQAVLYELPPRDPGPEGPAAAAR